MEADRGLFDLTGRVALVTGAASGLGLAAAVGLARHGADVACVDLRAELCGETVDRVRALGRRGLALGVDVTDERGVRAAVERTVAELGKLDILLNAAGITKRVPSTEIRPEDWRRVVEVDLVGTFLCCQAAGRQMLRQGNGSIINVSSIAGFGGIGRGNTAYSASKAGVIGLTRELAVEWAPTVRVTALAPVQFRTPFIAAVLADEELTKRMIAKIPMGRMGEPEEIVGPVVFLASDASSLVTGVTLPVDGGYLAQ